MLQVAHTALSLAANAGKDESMDATKAFMEAKEKIAEYQNLYKL